MTTQSMGRSDFSWRRLLWNSYGRGVLVLRWLRWPLIILTAVYLVIRYIRH